MRGEYSDKDLELERLMLPLLKRLPPVPEVRSMLGKALREICCPWQQRACRGCDRYQECTFALLFDPFNPTSMGPSTPPPPFALYGEDERTLGVLLMGPAVRRTGVILAALAAALNSKLEVPLTQLSARLIETRWPVVRLGELVARRAEELGSRLLIRTTSPLRILRNGQPSQVIQLGEFLESIARRARLLLGFYGRKVRRSEIGRILDSYDHPEAFEVFASFSWREARRHSSRQRRVIPIGGVMGEFELWDVKEDLKRLLVLGEILGVGKGTTQGNGRFEIINLEG